MQQITITDKSYTEWVSQLSQRYRKSQIKAAVKVNSEMLKFYWSLGRDIVKNYLDNKYGSQFYSVLSSDLRRELPDVSGLSERNIRYMKDFYLLYSQESNSATTRGKIWKLYPTAVEGMIPSIEEIETKLANLENNNQK